MNIIHKGIPQEILWRTVGIISEESLQNFRENYRSNSNLQGRTLKKCLADIFDNSEISTILKKPLRRYFRNNTSEAFSEFQKQFDQEFLKNPCSSLLKESQEEFAKISLEKLLRKLLVGFLERYDNEDFIAQIPEEILE